MLPVGILVILQRYSVKLRDRALMLLNTRGGLLGIDDAECEENAESEANERPSRYGVVVPARPCERQHHKAAKQDEPHGEAFRDRSR
jgi:hypothetical protein